MPAVELDAARLAADGAALHSIAQTAWQAARACQAALGGTGGMAGDEESAEAFAHGQDGEPGYDGYAKDVLTGVINAANTLKTLDAALGNTGRAYDGAQLVGAFRAASESRIPEETAVPFPASVSVPTALGPGPQTPLGEFGEFLQDALAQIGVRLPDADTGKLGTAESAWNELSRSLSSVQGRVEGAFTSVSAMTLPQQSSMLTCQTKLASSFGSLSESASSMGSFARSMIDETNKAWEEIGWFIAQMAVEIAVEIGVGVLLGAVTFGAGAAAMAAKIAFTVMRWAIKIANLCRKLRTLIMAALRAARVAIRGGVRVAREALSAGLASAITTTGFNTVRGSLDPSYQPQNVLTAALAATAGGGAGGFASRVGGAATSNIGNAALRRTTHIAVETGGGAIDGLVSAGAESGLNGTAFNPLSAVVLGSLLGGSMAGRGPGGARPTSSPGGGAGVSPGSGAIPTPGGAAGSGSVAGPGGAAPAAVQVDAPAPGAAAGSGTAAAGDGSGVTVNNDGPTPGGGAADGGAAAGDGGSVDVSSQSPDLPAGLGADGPSTPSTPDASSPDASSTPAAAAPDGPPTPDASSTPSTPDASSPDASSTPAAAAAASSPSTPDAPASPAAPDAPASAAAPSAPDGGPSASAGAVASSDAPSHADAGSPDAAPAANADAPSSGVAASSPGAPAAQSAAPTADAPAGPDAASTNAPGAAAPAGGVPAASTPPSPTTGAASPDGDARPPHSDAYNAPSQDGIEPDQAALPDGDAADAGDAPAPEGEGSPIEPEAAAAAAGAATAAGVFAAPFVSTPAGSSLFGGSTASHVDAVESAPGGDSASSQTDAPGEATNATAADARAESPSPHASVPDPSSPGGEGVGGVDRTALTTTQVDETVQAINPQFDPFALDNGFATNCGHTASILNDALNGTPVREAPGGSTLDLSQMAAATGRPQAVATPAQIEATLRAAGAGSHCVVGIDRAGEPGHWFNAYFDGTDVWTLDAQTGARSPWPPDEPNATTWDVSIDQASLVDPDGTRVHEPAPDADGSADAASPEPAEGRTGVPGDAGSNARIDEFALAHGHDLGDLHDLRRTPADQLTPAQRDLLQELRRLIDPPAPGTPLVKVIPIDDVGKYLHGPYSQVGGYVARATDLNPWGGLSQIVADARLDYTMSDGSPSPYQRPGATEYGFIEFRTPDAAMLEVPFSPEFGGTVTDGAPFTGSGFLGNLDDVWRPEYRASGRLSMMEGARLWIVGPDGPRLVAIFDPDRGFTRVGVPE